MTNPRLKIARILCPTDFSDFSQRALERAVRLAGWFDARVTLLHVIPPIPWALPAHASVPYVAMPADLLRTVREEVEKELGRFAAAFLEDKVPVETRLEDGDPARVIQAIAQSLPAGLIVMGTHGRAGFEHLVLGSVTEKVLRRASCPVLTVGKAVEPPSGALFRRILCAADLTDSSRPTIEMALALAQENMARVTFLHVVESLPGEAGSELYVPSPASGMPPTDLAEQARERLAWTVPDSARDFCEVSEKVEMGTAWREILRTAEDTKADLIVLGAHSRGILGRMFLGSTSNQVVRQAPCPVLVVRQAPASAAHDRPEALAATGA